MSRARRAPRRARAYAPGIVATSAILAALGALAVGVNAATAPGPAAAPSSHPRKCLTTPRGIEHRPLGAGALEWRDTLAFLPPCARPGPARHAIPADPRPVVACLQLRGRPDCFTRTAPR